MFQKIGEPIEYRYAESTKQQHEFEELNRYLMMLHKALKQWRRGEEKYNHIEKVDMEKVKIMLTIRIRTEIIVQNLALKLY